MKRMMCNAMLLALTSLFVFSCTKDNPIDGTGNFGDGPRTAVPDELVGYWLNGTSSISNFWGYDGSYQGAAYELALGYQIYKDGRAKQYFYYTNTSYNCRMQTLGYKEGTVEVDLTDKTLKFYPASGNYRNYNSCSSSTNGRTKQYTSTELYPNKKSEYSNIQLVTQNGQVTSWRVPYSDGSVADFKKSQLQ